MDQLCINPQKNHTEPAVFDINQRIRELCQKNHITIYRLSKISGVPYSALNSMFKRNTSPCFHTLFKICSGLNISLSDFFSEGTVRDNLTVNLTEDARVVIELYIRLPTNKQKLLFTYLQGLCANELSNLYDETL